MKISNIVIIVYLLIFMGCSRKNYVVKWRIEPSGINADTIAEYKKEKISKDNYVHLFGDSVKILKSNLDSLLLNWNQKNVLLARVEDMYINVSAKSLVSNTDVYKISIQQDTFFNEDVAHFFYYSPKYGVIIKMFNRGLYSHFFFTVVAVKDRTSSIYNDIDLEELSRNIYNDSILFWRPKVNYENN